MPLIDIKYDDKQVGDSEIKILSTVVQEIVSQATRIEDVFVYADSAKISVKVAPIEIFIKMSADKITDQSILLTEIKSKLSDFKSKNNFSHPINLTLIPMQWKIEIGI